MSRSATDRLRLPTDEELDRAIAEWKARVPAGQGNGDRPAAPAALPAPAPIPDRRELIRAASEILTTRTATKPTPVAYPKQVAYRQRCAAAGRCPRCGGAVDPGHTLCATHRRYWRRASMLRRHGTMVDEVVSALRSDPTLFGPETAPEFQAEVFLILMFRGLRPPTAALLAGFSDAERDAMLARLTENGIYRRSPHGHVSWHGDFFNKETGAVEFIMTVGVALGTFVRIPEVPDPPTPQARPARPSAKKKSRSHDRRPPEACLLCRRVKGRCKRHGGPNRSTSFRGAAPRCSYCKRPKGHAPTCRRAR